jgi:very-short-patch-repair endonuclease
MEYFHYDKKLRKRARELRSKSTWSEIVLWKYLRKGRMCGHRFLRQRPVGHFIVDFYCPEHKLAIELDGKIHEKQTKKDNIRQKELESLGITILRFTNYQVKKDLHIVLKTIEVSVASPLSGESGGAGGVS